MATKPCKNYAPDTLNPIVEDQDICTTCFYRRVDHVQISRSINLLKVLTQMRRDNPALFSAVKDYVQAAKQQNSEATKCP